VSGTADIPVSRVEWKGAVRIIRSAFPPIDLFEDIADPADWPLLISAEQKTNPRIMATIGNLDLVPVDRRVGGNGASYLMAPFTHVSTDRPSRFTDGSYGVLYVGDRFETALFETIHHHARFMARTKEAPGWTSQFREIVMSVDADLHDLRALAGEPVPALDPDSYAHLKRSRGTSGARDRTGLPTRASGIPVGNASRSSTRTARQIPLQGRHLDYHWDGARVDLVRDAGSGAVFRIVDLPPDPV
jgi:hypothetical protein